MSVFQVRLITGYHSLPSPGSSWLSFRQAQGFECYSKEPSTVSINSIPLESLGVHRYGILSSLFSGSGLETRSKVPSLGQVQTDNRGTVNSLPSPGSSWYFFCYHSDLAQFPLSLSRQVTDMDPSSSPFHSGCW